jgi:hypothetical protein
MSEKKSLGEEEIISGRKLGRRSMALVGSAAAGAMAALGMVGTTACCMGGGTGGRVATGCSDTDPTDGGGFGTHCGGAVLGTSGCSDTDPNDPGGAGIHCGAGAVPVSGCSDSDPVDPGGNGRTCAGGGVAPVPPPSAPPAPPT